MADWFGPNAGLLGGSDNPWGYIGDLGMGLLAASGPSREPQGGFGSILGKAGAYASGRESDRIQNDTRRMAMKQAMDQQAAEAEMKAAIASGDEASIRASAIKAYPELYAKSLFPTTPDAETTAKLLDIQERIKTREATGDATRAATVGLRVANEGYVDSSQQAVNAIKWIQKNMPDRADAIISSGANTALARQLNNWGVGKALPAELTGVKPELIPELLNKMEAIQKARKTIAIGLANNQQGVVGLLTAGESLGEGAGAKLNLHQFEEALRRGKRVAALNEWELPPGITVGEAEAAGIDVKGAGKPASEIKPPAPIGPRGGAPAPGGGGGGMSFSPQGGVQFTPPGQSLYSPLPPPVTTDMPPAGGAEPPAPPAVPTSQAAPPTNILPAGAAPPPAAARPPAPPVNRVKTTVINPLDSKEVPVFQRKADALRGVPLGATYAMPDGRGDYDLYTNDGR